LAWFDRSEHHRPSFRRFFSRHQGVLVATWPVLTEVCHLVPTTIAPRFLERVRLGGMVLHDLLPGGGMFLNVLEEED
jgi:hypothetical protein